MDVFRVKGKRWIKLSDILVSRESPNDDHKTVQWALVLSKATVDAGVVSVHLHTPHSGTEVYGLVAELWAYAEDLEVDHLLTVVDQFITEVDILDNKVQDLVERIGL